MEMLLKAGANPNAYNRVRCHSYYKHVARRLAARGRGLLPRMGDTHIME